MNKNLIPNLTLIFLLFISLAIPLNAKEKKGEMDQVQQNEGYSLLYKLLGDESQLDQILIIKSAKPPIPEILKQISTMSSKGKENLEKLSSENPKLNLHLKPLPYIEMKAREGIRSDTTHALLSRSGSRLGVRLLLTQTDALNYMHYLAFSLLARESRSDRQEFLNTLIQQSTVLRGKVISNFTLSQ